MKPSQIAAQLYTCRDLLKTPSDIARTLRRVREAGYQAVQVSGMGPIGEDELLRILDGEGLVCCATHESGEMILNEPARVIERLQKLRCKATAYPYPGGIDLNNLESIDGLINGLERSGAALAAAGLSLSYHNHHQEFRKINGERIIDRLFARTTPAHLKAELDTYWVQFGGGDPATFCEQLAGRLHVMHLKDYMINADNQPTFCEVGSGNLDFRRIIAAAGKSGCEWFIVEQDTTPGDPVDSLAQSHRWLVENIC